MHESAVPDWPKEVFVHPVLSGRRYVASRFRSGTKSGLIVVVKFTLAGLLRTLRRKARRAKARRSGFGEGVRVSSPRLENRPPFVMAGLPVGVRLWKDGGTGHAIDAVTAEHRRQHRTDQQTDRHGEDEGARPEEAGCQ